MVGGKRWAVDQTRENRDEEVIGRPGENSKKKLSKESRRT
jgi:hypothetical protein